MSSGGAQQVLVVRHVDRNDWVPAALSSPFTPAAWFDAQPVERPKRSRPQPWEQGWNLTAMAFAPGPWGFEAPRDERPAKWRRPPDNDPYPFDATPFVAKPAGADAGRDERTRPWRRPPENEPWSQDALPFTPTSIGWLGSAPDRPMGPRRVPVSDGDGQGAGGTLAELDFIVDEPPRWWKPFRAALLEDTPFALAHAFPFAAISTVEFEDAARTRAWRRPVQEEAFVPPALSALAVEGWIGADSSRARPWRSPAVLPENPTPTGIPQTLAVQPPPAVVESTRPARLRSAALLPDNATPGPSPMLLFPQPPVRGDEPERTHAQRPPLLPENPTPGPNPLLLAPQPPVRGDEPERPRQLRAPLHPDNATPTGAPMVLFPAAPVAPVESARPQAGRSAAIAPENPTPMGAPMALFPQPPVSQDDARVPGYRRPRQDAGPPPPPDFLVQLRTAGWEQEDPLARRPKRPDISETVTPPGASMVGVLGVFVPVEDESRPRLAFRRFDEPVFIPGAPALPPAIPPNEDPRAPAPRGRRGLEGTAAVGALSFLPPLGEAPPADRTHLARRVLAEDVGAVGSPIVALLPAFAEVTGLEEPRRARRALLDDGAPVGSPLLTILPFAAAEEAARPRCRRAWALAPMDDVIGPSMPPPPPLGWLGFAPEKIPHAPPPVHVVDAWPEARLGEFAFNPRIIPRARPGAFGTRVGARGNSGPTNDGRG